MRSRSAVLALSLALVLAACGGDNGDEADAGSNGESDQASGAGDASSSGGGGSIDGFVTVNGETFEFSFDSPGRCGLDGDQGRVVHQGIMDDGRQVVFTYGLAEETDNGEAQLQIVLYNEDGTQRWYSAVGFLNDDVGSVDSLTKSGDTVSALGQLQFAEDQSLADFTAKATCSQ